MKRAFGLTPGLQARGCRVEICLEDHPDNRAEIERLAGCRAHYYRRGTAWHEYRQKLKLIADCGCDVIHICGLGWRNALLERGKSPPIVMDHVELESAIQDSSFLRTGSQLLLEWASLFGYHNTVMASDFLEALFRKRSRRLGLNRRMIVLPYAGDIPSSNGLQATSQIKHSSRERQVILYMGSLYKNFGCLDIVEALHGLLANRQDWDAIILGCGPEEQRMKEAVARLGLRERVDLRGYVSGDALAALLAVADVFLAPLCDTVLDWARCPGKTYIYMMQARPIVTCRVGETYKALGANGFYYEPQNIPSMTRALISALEVPADWHPTYDLREHTWDARAETYLRWLQGWVPSRKQGAQNAL
jgi:glycosyltransferase involved in cell wall biosynthesis